MAELHVRSLPQELYEQLHALATAEGRSMSAQAVVLLRRSLQPDGEQPARTQAAVERLREIRRRSPLLAGMPTAELLVRVDRDHAG